MAQNNWIKHPTKKQLVLVCAAWFTSTGLSLSAATNFFTESPFTQPFGVMHFISLPVTVIVLATVANYIRNRRKQQVQ